MNRHLCSPVGVHNKTKFYTAFLNSVKRPFEIVYECVCWTSICISVWRKATRRLLRNYAFEKYIITSSNKQNNSTCGVWWIANFLPNHGLLIIIWTIRRINLYSFDALINSSCTPDTFLRTVLVSAIRNSSISFTNFGILSVNWRGYWKWRQYIKNAKTRSGFLALHFQRLKFPDLE